MNNERTDRRRYIRRKGVFMVLVGKIKDVCERLKFYLAYFGDGVTVEQVERALQ